MEHLLGHLDELERHVEQISGRIAEQLRPFENLIAKIGVDMSVFPDEHHLSSWAGICPGNEESAGKRLRSRTTRKNRWLRRALVEAAWAAGRAKSSYLGAQYRRLSARRGSRVTA